MANVTLLAIALQTTTVESTVELKLSSSEVVTVLNTSCSDATYRRCHFAVVGGSLIGFVQVPKNIDMRQALEEVHALAASDNSIHHHVATLLNTAAEVAAVQEDNHHSDVAMGAKTAGMRIDQIVAVANRVGLLSKHAMRAVLLGNIDQSGDEIPSTLLPAAGSNVAFDSSPDRTQYCGKQRNLWPSFPFSAEFNNCASGPPTQGMKIPNPNPDHNPNRFPLLSYCLQLLNVDNGTLQVLGHRTVHLGGTTQLVLVSISRKA